MNDSTQKIFIMSAGITTTLNFFEAPLLSVPYIEWHSSTLYATEFFYFHHSTVY
jgi:hypothetical protein